MRPFRHVGRKGGRSRRRHAVGRLPRRHEPHAVAGRVRGRPQRLLDDATGFARMNRRADNREEIESALWEREGQFERFGSDQVESPVTTSNFLRRELTS